MPWIKKGMVYRPDGSLPHSRTHAQVPFAFPLKNGRVRIYISSRDEQSQSRPTFIEVDENDFNNVLCVHDKPVLDIGQMPASEIRSNDNLSIKNTSPLNSRSSINRINSTRAIARGI